MLIYRLLNGMCGFHRNGEHTPLPSGVAETLTISDGDNPAVVKSIAVTPEAYSLVNGVLLKDGSPVTIRPDGSMQRAIHRLMDAVESLLNGDPALAARLCDRARTLLDPEE